MLLLNEPFSIKDGITLKSAQTGGLINCNFRSRVRILENVFT